MNFLMILLCSLERACQVTEMTSQPRYRNTRATCQAVGEEEYVGTFQITFYTCMNSQRNALYALEIFGHEQVL